MEANTTKIGSLTYENSLNTTSDNVENIPSCSNKQEEIISKNDSVQLIPSSSSKQEEIFKEDSVERNPPHTLVSNQQTVNVSVTNIYFRNHY